MPYVHIMKKQLLNVQVSHDMYHMQVTCSYAALY